MSSRKYYSSEPRRTSETFGDSASGYDPRRSSSYGISQYEPKESKIEREKYLGKEDSKRVSENVSTSVVTRSVVDRKTFTSYSSREENKSTKTRDSQGQIGRDARLALSSSVDKRRRDSETATDAEEKGKKTPISSFYSSYSKDEDLSGVGKVDKSTDDVDDLISAFYRSGDGSKHNSRVLNTRTDRSVRDARGGSKYGVSSEKGGKRTGEKDSVTYSNYKDALEKQARRAGEEADRTEPGSSRLTVEDTNILRRALERKQATDSLERERIEKKLHEGERDDHLQTRTSSIYSSFDSKRGIVEKDVRPASKVYTSLSDKDRFDDKDKGRDSVRSSYSHSLEGRDEPRSTGYRDVQTGSSITTRYDRDTRRASSAERERDRITDRLTKYDLATEKPGRSPRSSTKEPSGKDRKRSLSSEAADRKERSRLGIYREIPGRKEFLEYTSGSTNISTSRFDEDKETSKDYKRAGSTERYAGSADYRGRRDDAVPDYLLKGRPSDEMRSGRGKDDYKDRFSSDRTRLLNRQSNVERDETTGSDGTGWRDIGKRNDASRTARKDPSTSDKLREEIAKLKAETESRDIKKDDYVPISSYSTGRESLIRDKLKEDIVKLKLETLSRDHARPDVLPYSSRPEPAEVVRASGPPRLESRDVLPYSSRPEAADVVRASGPPRLESRDVLPYSSRPEAADVVKAREPPRLESRKPSVQDKLKADIAKLKADTRDLASLPKTTLSDITSSRDLPGSRVEDRREVHRRGIATTSSTRGYSYSKQDGDVFRDEITKEETQRYGTDKEPGERYTTYPRRSSTEEGKPVVREGSGKFGKWPRDDEVPGSSREYTRRGSEESSVYPRRPDEAVQSWPTREGDKTQIISPRNIWDDPRSTPRGDRLDSAQGYASKRVYRADSTVSMTSTRNDEGPADVRGYYRGSVSKEDREAYFTRRRSDVEDAYPSEPGRRPEPVRRPDVAIPLPGREPRRRSDVEDAYPAEAGRRPEPARWSDVAIPMPGPEPRSTTHKPDDAMFSPRGMKDDPREKKELHSSKVQSSREFVSRKNIIREDSVISTSQDEKSQEDISRGLHRGSLTSPRKPSIKRGMLPIHEDRVSSPQEAIAPVPEETASKPSGISALRKKIDQLKNKVDELDDSRSKRQLEKYVRQHSEKKPEVEIKDPVEIRRYKLSERSSIADEEDPTHRRQSTDVTSDMINRQISRQTSLASTIRRISSLREEDLRPMPLSPVQEALPDDVFPGESKPEEKPEVVMCDAETMTMPEPREEIGTGRIRRQESVITEIIDERDKLKVLRGVPIDHRGTMTEQVVSAGQEGYGGPTTIQIDEQQKALVPQKDLQGWWNAFTAEDVDRLLEIGTRRWWNAYTAEDMDNMLNLEPAKRLSFRRGSFERRSFRRQPRGFKDDNVDVHIRVRGRQQEKRDPRYIVAQAAPEEKAIVLHDVKESADPFIKKIKVDDVYGADAVRVENGVVKIRVGELTPRGRRAWARILQQKNRVIESDGTVIIPIGNQYEDGVYQTRYHQEGGDQNGVIRIPIKLTLRETEKAKAKKLRVVKRAGSFRKKRRTQGRGYIAGAKYYNGEMLLAMDGSAGSQGRQRSRDIVWRGRRESAKTGGGEIVIRGNPPYSTPMQTLQRIHEGHRVTRQAASWRNEGGKMIINIHAVPPKQPRFNIRQVGENMARTSGMLTSRSYDENMADRNGPSGTYITSSGSGRQGFSGTSGSYSVYPTSGTYVTSSASGRQGFSGTSDGYSVYPTSGRNGTSGPSGTYVASGRQGFSGTSGDYSVYPTSGRNGTSGPSGPYIVSTTSSRQGPPVAYIVSDPSDSFGRDTNASGRPGVTRISTVNGVSATPTIIPLNEEYVYTGKPGMYHDSLITGMTGYSGVSGTKIPVSDPRLYAETGYGENFNLRDHGDVSSVRIVKGPLENGRKISERRTSNGRYRYGSAWSSKQQETLDGRRMAWVVEEAVPDF